MNTKLYIFFFVSILLISCKESQKHDETAIVKELRAKNAKLLVKNQELLTRLRELQSSSSSKNNGGNHAGTMDNKDNLSYEIKDSILKNPKIFVGHRKPAYKTKSKYELLLDFDFLANLFRLNRNGLTFEKQAQIKELVFNAVDLWRKAFPKLTSVGVNTRIINDSVPDNCYPVAVQGFKTERSIRETLETYFTEDFTDSVIEANVMQYPFEEGKLSRYYSLNGRLYAHCCGEGGVDPFLRVSYKDMIIDKANDRNEAYRIFLPVYILEDTPTYELNNITDVFFIHGSVGFIETEDGLKLKKFSTHLVYGYHDM